MKIISARALNRAISVCVDRNTFLTQMVFISPPTYSNSWLRFILLLDPPNPPEITGYKTGEVVKTGETKKLLCVARGGNPPAQVGQDH